MPPQDNASGIPSAPVGKLTPVGQPPQQFNYNWNALDQLDAGNTGRVLENDIPTKPVGKLTPITPHTGQATAISPRQHQGAGWYSGMVTGAENLEDRLLNWLHSGQPHPGGMDFTGQADPATFMAGPLTGPLEVAQSTGQIGTSGQRVAGAGRALGGLMQTPGPFMAPLMGPEGLAQLPAWGAGTHAATKGLEKAGVSPEASDLISNLSMLGFGAAHGIRQAGKGKIGEVGGEVSRESQAAPSGLEQLQQALAQPQQAPTAAKTSPAPTSKAAISTPMGEKAAKIESQQVKAGPTREAWVQQNKDYVIGKMQEVVNNPSATPEEKSVAQSFIAEMRGEGKARATDIPTAPVGKLTPVEAPSAAKPISREAQAKASVKPSEGPIQAKAEVQPISKSVELGQSKLGKVEEDIARLQAQKTRTTATQKGLKARTPEELAEDERLLSGAQRQPTDTAKPTEAAYPSSETPSEPTPGESSAQPGSAESLGKSQVSPEEVAKTYGLQYRGEVSPGTGVHDFKHPDGGSFALKESQLGHKAFIENKLAQRKAEIKPSELSPILAEKAKTFEKPSQAISKTPLERTQEPQEPRTGASPSQASTAPQRPLESSLKPKMDPGDQLKMRGGMRRRSILSGKPLTGEEGFLSLGGKKPRSGVPNLISKIFSKKTDLSLHELSSKQGADYLRATQELKESRGSAKDYEDIYHHLEDPNHPLTPAQEQLMRDEITSWIDEANRARTKLNERGWTEVPGLDENYVHRIALAKDSKLEKVLTQRMKYSSGARLSKSASGMQARTMLGLEGPKLGGQKVVAHWDPKTDQVKALVRGQEYKLGTRTDLESQGYKFGQATTKEIETHSAQRYYKNALVSSVLNGLELRRAERASDTLEAMKSDPDFKKVAMERGKGTTKPGWGPTNVPQLKNYNFEPRTRDVLNRYWDEVTRGEPSGLEKLNDFLRTSIFFNPLMHTKNIAVHWAVEKGVTGFSPTKWGTIAKTSSRAIEAVLNKNNDYISALDDGAALQSYKRATREMESLLVSKMAQQFQDQPKLGNKVSKLLGYANPKELVRGIYDFSNKVTWTFDDMARLQSIYQHMEEHKGMTFKEASNEVNKHLPDYRIPTRVMDSPMLGTILRNKNLTMFSAYHYGALKSYVEMAKDLVSQTTPPAERAQAFNRLAMLGLITAVIYPSMDHLAKRITGKEDARLDRSGASTFVNNLYEMFRGQKGAYAVGHAAMTPSPVLEYPFRLAGEPAISRVSHRKPVPFGKQAMVLGKEALNEIGPIGQSGITRHGTFDPYRFFWGMLGVRYGTDAPDRSKGGIGKLSGLRGIAKIK